MNRPPVAAIDLGGTKIAVGLVNDGYRVLARAESPTIADEGVAGVVERLVSAVEQVTASGGLALKDLYGLSVAAAGAIDSERGIVTLSPNLPGWRDIHLRDMLNERLGVKTWLLNDAKAAALGEHRFGAGKGVSNLVHLTVGTGIGGGIIIDGRLYTGASGSAGEIGHMTIDVNGPRCPCGNTGCLEMLASGKAMVRDALARLNAEGKSLLTEMVNGDLDRITAREIGLAAEHGDSLASDVISRAASYLAVGMVNLANIFNPEMIIVGGGIANLGDRLLDPARRLVKERAFPVASAAVRIVLARLGNDAGLLGAAYFAFEGDK
jgi:glucokinase